MRTNCVTRRDFLKISGAGLAAAGLAALAKGAAPAAAARGSAVRQAQGKPNIIFILADDLGYGDLGCFGQKRIKTPCLDRLAAEGMRFTDCYAGSTVCAPSRSCLMTGQHCGHTIVRGNGNVPLRLEDVTVAECLKRAGYATALILSGVLMLDYLGEAAAAKALEDAVAAVIAEGRSVTYDMKPHRDDPTAVGTSQMADAIIAAMGR